MWAMPDLRWTTGKKVSFLLDGLKHTATPIAAPFFTIFVLDKSVFLQINSSSKLQDTIV